MPNWGRRSGVGHGALGMGLCLSGETSTGWTSSTPNRPVSRHGRARLRGQRNGVSRGASGRALPFANPYTIKSLEPFLTTPSSNKGTKRSIFVVGAVAASFWIFILWYWNHKSEERRSAREAAQPVWNTEKKIPVTAACRETHATQAGIYSGDVVWLVEAKTGARRTIAVLLQDPDDAKGWLERTMHALSRDVGSPAIYTPPPTVVLVMEGDHVLPRSGESSSLDGKRSSYPVTCSTMRVQG